MPLTIHRNDYNILFIGKCFAIVERYCSTSGKESATIQPYENSFLGFASLWFGPHIQRQAILTKLVTDLVPFIEDFAACRRETRRICGYGIDL